MVAVIPPQARYNSFEIPERRSKNDRFESFVLRHLFPSELYTCIHHSGYLKNGGRLPEKTISNRVLVRDNTSGFEFYLECKHHFGFIANSFRFSKTLPVGYFKSDTDRAVVRVLGLGGTAEMPLELFLIPADSKSQVHLKKRHLIGKTIGAYTSIHPSNLLKQLRFSELNTKRIA